MALFGAVRGIMGLVKATIPVTLCGAALSTSTYPVHRAHLSYFPPDTHYKVDVVVHAPEGTEIKQLPPATL